MGRQDAAGGDRRRTHRDAGRSLTSEAPPLLPGPFWLVGCGNMAGAMLEGWLAGRMDPDLVTVIRPSGKPVAEGVRVLTALPQGEVPALVMLGVKPQKLDDIAGTLSSLLGPGTILISLLAGVEQQSLRARFPTPRTIVRAMPNTPARLRKSATALYSDSADAEARGWVERLMQQLGHVEWLDEKHFNLVTALSGAGPAFLYRYMEAMTAAGVALGLSPEQADRLVRATVEGAAALAAASEESPRRLAERVASPGGATAKGLAVLDDEHRLEALVRETIEAAARRGAELAKEARRSTD